MVTSITERDAVRGPILSKVAAPSPSPPGGCFGAGWLAPRCRGGPLLGVGQADGGEARVEEEQGLEGLVARDRIEGSDGRELGHGEAVAPRRRRSLAACWVRVGGGAEVG